MVNISHKGKGIKAGEGGTKGAQSPTQHILGSPIQDPQQDMSKAHWLSKPTLVGGLSLSTPGTSESFQACCFLQPMLSTMHNQLIPCRVYAWFFLPSTKIQNRLYYITSKKRFIDHAHPDYCDNPDKDGLITAGLLTLPGSPPLLVASVWRGWRKTHHTQQHNTNNK